MGKSIAQVLNGEDLFLPGGMADGYARGRENVTFVAAALGILLDMVYMPGGIDKDTRDHYAPLLIEAKKRTDEIRSLLCLRDVAERSDLLFSWGNGQCGSGYFCGALYRSVEGEYFIVVEGDDTAAYARSCDTDSLRYEWSRIRAVSKEEAMAWMKKHNGTEELKLYFSSEIEEALKKKGA